MEYSKTIIDFTKTSNIPNSDQEIVYELPSEEFWITIKDLFENKTFQKQAQVVAHILGDCDGPIERKSFVKRNDVYYPLLNYGILTDYYKMLLSSASEPERHDHIIETIHSLLENTFNFSENTPNRVLINPKIMSNDLKSKIVDKGLIFATATKNNVVIALDQSVFSDKSFFGDAINKIEQELVKDELCIIEPYLRDPTKGHCGIKLSSSAEIVYRNLSSIINAFEGEDFVMKAANFCSKIAHQPITYSIENDLQFDEKVLVLYRLGVIGVYYGYEQAKQLGRCRASYVFNEGLNPIDEIITKKHLQGENSVHLIFNPVFQRYLELNMNTRDVIGNYSQEYVLKNHLRKDSIRRL